MLSPGGSIPTGQPVTASWIAIGALSQTINYTTYTGGVSGDVAFSGSVTYTPVYDNVSTFIVNTLNDVGPGSCNAAITTSNLPPDIYPIVYTGSEDDIQINATLS